MEEEDIKTILEEPIPKGSAKKNKRKNNKKKKETKPKNPEPEKEEQQTEQTEQTEQETNDSLDSLSVPISLNFIVFMRNLLNSIVPRTQWRPEEMAPVGMAINDLTSLIQMATQSQSSTSDDTDDGEEETTDEVN
tara:strand:- start:29 stop:433 length:405 start_codon:yes stop_codon:yes gene_type:complete